MALQTRLRGPPQCLKLGFLQYAVETVKGTVKKSSNQRPRLHTFTMVWQTIEDVYEGTARSSFNKISADFGVLES